MASSFNLISNPELDRVLRISLPARRLLFIGGFAFMLVLVIAGLQWNHYATRDYYSEYDKITHAGRETYWMLTVVLFGLLFVLAPAMTALSFIQEKLRGTAIFQQMILLKPLDIAVGKFLGNGAASYFAALIILPFALFAALLGDQTSENVFNLYLFLIIGGLSFQAAGLFVSAALSGSAEKRFRGELLIGPAVGVLGAASAFMCYRDFTDYRGRTDNYWHFYGMTVESYVIILGLLIFMGVWAFAGAVRKIKASQLVPVRAWPVWLFFATAEALLVGILWGWQYYSSYQLTFYGTPPVQHLIFYMVINWFALITLAGSLALSRNRLREWWSAGDDPLGLFHRAEVRNSIKTFLIALGVSLTGLVALWIGYHADGDEFPQTLVLSQLVPIALGFTFAVAGALCFIQYSAMQRFRARAWAGVGLVLIFYLVLGVAGLLIDKSDNTANLVNPACFAYQLTEGDVYMDRNYVRYNWYDLTRVAFYNTTRGMNRTDHSGLIIHGLLAEGLLALGTFGLAYLKWRKLVDEMVESKDKG
jgi:hypothetical protein